MAWKMRTTELAGGAQSTPWRVRRRVWVGVALMALMPLFVGACSSELDPGKPEDAYLLFRNALIDGDAERVWERLDPATHQHFEQAHGRLVAMDRLIASYMPLTDHGLARQQSGAELAQSTKDGRALFLKVFQPQNLPKEQAIEVGSAVREIRMSEDGSQAVVVTRGEQEYMLERGKDEQWRVALLSSGDAVKKAFVWLDANEKALEQTVEDLKRSEQRRRETIISELMNLPKPE